MKIRLALATAVTALLAVPALAVWHELHEADEHHGIDPGYVVGQPLAILTPIAWGAVGLTILTAVVLILANPYSLPMSWWRYAWPWWTTDPDPRETGLHRSVITYTDPLPTLVVGERRPRVRGWAAAALGAEDGMDNLAHRLAASEEHAALMAQMLAAHDIAVPARPRPVLDETEAGAR